MGPHATSPSPSLSLPPSSSFGGNGGRSRSTLCLEDEALLALVARRLASAVEVADDELDVTLESFACWTCSRGEMPIFAPSFLGQGRSDEDH